MIREADFFLCMEDFTDLQMSVQTVCAGFTRGNKQGSEVSTTCPVPAGRIYVHSADGVHFRNSPSVQESAS